MVLHIVDEQDVCLRWSRCFCWISLCKCVSGWALRITSVHYHQLAKNMAANTFCALTK